MLLVATIFMNPLKASLSTNLFALKGLQILSDVSGQYDDEVLFENMKELISILFNRKTEASNLKESLIDFALQVSDNEEGLDIEKMGEEMNAAINELDQI